jgi:hypothetical protein
MSARKDDDLVAMITDWPVVMVDQFLDWVWRRKAQRTDERYQRPRMQAKGKRQSRAVYLTETALKITRRLMDEYPTGRLF